ncbi:REP-associated tyrosine transposase [Ottowia testudinis]|uniref:Transposase n=1 Tax=Ottowia testudinis TaxID=2816950 RepID=A0A975CN45_9BURK|nr:transposase [Ottowia testudinis]QTD46543.1 transposase [Ottowia testudinis]
MSRYRRPHLAGATWFFTATLADRRSGLLTQHIDLLRQAYRRAQAHYPFETIAICVLPEHLHTIWKLPEDDGDFSTRWRLFKFYFSSHFPASAERSQSKVAKGEKGIWQRRFWEHRIRDKQDLQRHVDYIHYNPVKHGLVRQAADWPYSSFHRFVAQGRLQAG